MACQAFHTYRAAVGIDDIFDQAQPQPVTMDLSGPDFGAAIEWLEYMRQVLRSYPPPPILNRDYNSWFGLDLSASRDADPPGLAAVLDCIVQYVPERRSERRPISQNDWQGLVDLLFQCPFASLAQLRVASEHLFDEPIQIDRRAMVQRFSAERPGELQDFFHHSGESSDVVANHHPAPLYLLSVGNQSVGEILADG